MAVLWLDVCKVIDLSVNCVSYALQVKSWPTQPLDAAISWLAGKPEAMTVADFGCGDARLAATVKQVRADL
jgi:ribosomal RNA-processing protein 8